MYSVKFTVGLLLTFFTLCNGGKILYLPFPLYNNVQTATWLSDDLQTYDHDLWIAYPQFLKSRNILRKNSSKFIKYHSLDGEDFEKVISAPRIKYYLDYDEYYIALPEQYKTAYGVILDTMYEFLLPERMPRFIGDRINDIKVKVRNDKELVRTLMQHKFDLVIVDQMLDYEIVLKKLGIPFCIIGEHEDSLASGNLINPSINPSPGSRLTDKMDIFQRVYNTVLYGFRLLDESMSANSNNEENDSSHPSMNAKLWLVTQDVMVVDYPRQAMPNTKFIGGLSIRKPNSLSQKMRQFYSKVSNGVVVVSFRNEIIDIKPSLVNKLLRACQETEFAFVFRLNITLSDENRMIASKYLNVNDLLADAKTMLLVTDCDTNSQYESISHGVPILCMPVMGNLFYNAKLIDRRGYGTYLNLVESTYQEISREITRVAQSSTMKEHVAKAAAVIKDRPMTARREAAYWIDHVVKYGDSHFRSFGLELPCYKYMCLDLLVVFGGLTGLVFWLFFGFHEKCLAGFFRSKDSHKSKTD